MNKSKKPSFPMISPEIAKEIKEIAEKLLPIPMLRKGKEGKPEYFYESYPISGARMLEINPDAKFTNKDGESEPCLPDGKYTFTSQEPAMVETKHHIKALRERYLLEGYKGILDYCTYVKETYLAYQQAKAKKDEKPVDNTQEEMKRDPFAPEPIPIVNPNDLPSKIE